MQSIKDTILERGFSSVSGPNFYELDLSWENIRSSWDNLEGDRYLSDGGSYRLRRYARFCVIPAERFIARLPHASFYQSAYTNKFAGGVERLFAPVEDTLIEDLCQIIRFDLSQLPCADSPDIMEVRAHQFRIVANGGGHGKPTPEGLHRDGADFLAMHFIGRNNVSGGMTYVMDANSSSASAITLLNMMDTLYLDDPRMLHYVTPVTAADSRSVGYRDVLVLDFEKKPDLVSPEWLEQQRLISQSKNTNRKQRWNF